MERCCIESLALKGIADGFAVTPEGGVWTCDVCGRHYQIVRGQWEATMPRVKGGRYYERGPSGRLSPTRPGDPDVIICRRVADFPTGVALPPGARVQPCARCQAPIVFNSARTYTAPLVCMQCQGIQPDPL